MSARNRRIFGTFFFLLFVTYWCGITCFTHSHVENGVIIVHSHPFKDAHHSHTDAQYETIFYLTHFFSMESAPYTFHSIERFATIIVPDFVWIRPVHHVILPSVLFMRGPPCRG